MNKDSVGSSRARRKICSFEGMRGVLALLVCCGHLGGGELRPCRSVRTRGGCTASGVGAAENVAEVLNAGIARGIAGFAIGGAAYIVSRRACNVLADRPWLTLIATACLTPFFLWPSWDWLTAGGFAIIVFFAVLLLSTDDHATPLSTGPLVYLGGISYSIYLLHIPVLATLMHLLPAELVRGSVGKPLLIATILLASAGCYRYFELPSQALLLRRLDRRSNERMSG